jgi:hypothetical protein
MVKTLTADDHILLSYDQLLSLMLQYVAYLSVHNRTDDPHQLVRKMLVDKHTSDNVMNSMLQHMANHGMPEEFPEDGSIFDHNSVHICNQSTNTVEEEYVISSSIFWVEGIFQTTIGALGIVGNVLAMCIYRAGGPKFYTIFYQLLICLLFLHTSYISLSLIMSFGRQMSGKVFVISYAYFLYPLPSLMMHSSTFITVLMAWHRFSAADHPMDYLVAWKFVNPRWSAFKALIVAMAGSFLLVTPLFFEPKVEIDRYIEYEEFNNTHIILVSFNSRIPGEP